MTAERYWTAAQTVSKMEHIVRREIEKTNHGAFLPTFARHWKVDGRQYSKEYPLIGGYVFFLQAEDWAGIPDIHGVYRVLASSNGVAKRVSETEMARLVIGHAARDHSRTDPAKFTKYYRPEPQKQRNSRRRRRPRPGKRFRAEASAA